MANKRRTSEQIGRMLREAEVELSKGLSVKEVAKKLAITGCFIQTVLLAVS